MLFHISECGEGHYGSGCNETCGHCFNTTCDAVLGSCTHDCIPGYDFNKDNTCKTSKYDAIQITALLCVY